LSIGSSTSAEITRPAGTRLAGIVRDCGVVGAGGAGFPTHVKLGGACRTVIANGAECEPLLQNDKYIMETEAEKITAALELVVKELKAEEGVITLKQKNETAVERLEEAAEKRGPLSLFLLENFYPAGDEHVLVYEVTGRAVPQGGIPLSVGAVVLNVETLLNIYNAAFENRPVTTRTVTCTGEVKKPAVLRAPIGTPIREIIRQCGGALADEPALILGGPMMGTVTTDLDTPLDKVTGGVIVLPRDHELVQRKSRPLEVQVRLSRSACCQCVLCSELCPREMLGHDLYPHLIMRQINYGLDFPEQALAAAALCCECGVCEVYACPMGLSPSYISRVIKQQFAEEGYKPVFGEKEPIPHEMRDSRKVPAERIVQRCMLGVYDQVIYDRGRSVDAGGRVEVPLKQHTGAPAKPVVSKGAEVGPGDLLGEIPEGNLGARVHAPIGGRVTLVDDTRVMISASGI
jgi:Na+-translocating ferredoxin:NAD+ oxidoreductase RnfC subunit